MISSAVAHAKNYTSRFLHEAKKHALGFRDAAAHRAGLLGSFLFNAVGGWRTVEIVRRILAYLCVLVVVIVAAACLLAASFGIAVVFAFFTRQYILYDLPVSSVHQVHDWTPVPSLSERWRLYQEVDDLTATASSSLLSTLGRAVHQQQTRGAPSGGDTCGSQTTDGSCPTRHHPHALTDGTDVVETALASLYRRVNTVKLVSAEQAASALVGTGSIRLQPTGWRTRNNWNSPLEFDEAVEDPDATGDGADGSAHARKASSGSWFVNEDAIFLPSGPRFSQTASYSSTLRVVSACPSGAGSSMALEATMLIAADDRPQPNHKLQPLFRKTRTVVVPGQHFIVFAVRWAWQTALYIPFLCVNFLSSLIVWRTDDQVLIAASSLAPGECSVDVPLYASFAPPKELLQRLRLVNFTLLSSSPSSVEEESLPTVQVRRLFFFHNVEHFGLAYLFSEYPLITMWVATVVWFCVLVSLIVSGTLTIVVIGYRTVYGAGERDVTDDGEGRPGSKRRGRAGRGEAEDEDDGERLFGRRSTTPPPFSAGASTGEVLRRRRSVSLK